MPDLEAFGGSSGKVMHLALQAVGDFMQSVQPGAMVQRFILIVENVDEEGRHYSVFTDPGSKHWDALGLLAYAMAMESNTKVVGEDDP